MQKKECLFSFLFVKLSPHALRKHNRQADWSERHRTAHLLPLLLPAHSARQSFFTFFPNGNVEKQLVKMCKFSSKANKAKAAIHLEVTTSMCFVWVSIDFSGSLHWIRRHGLCYYCANSGLCYSPTIWLNTTGVFDCISQHPDYWSSKLVGEG